MGAAPSTVKAVVFAVLAVAAASLAVAVPVTAIVCGPVSLMCAYKATQEFAQAIQVPADNPLFQPRPGTSFVLPETFNSTASVSL